MTKRELVEALAGMPEDAEIELDADGGHNALFSVRLDDDGTIRMRDEYAHESREMFENAVRSGRPIADAMAEARENLRRRMDADMVVVWGVAGLKL